MEKVWEIKDPDEYFQPQKTRRLTKEAPRPDEKNPATAYTLSTFFWGGGQIYNDQMGKGILFLSSMLFFCAGIVLSFVHQQFLLRFLNSYNITNAVAFLTAEVLLFCALIFWKYNAGDAYHKAAKARRAPFKGVTSRAYPFLCSLLVPGWGQFLNGQPIKGSMYAGFSILSLFSVVSIPSILLVWHSLEISDARFLIEAIFAITLLFAPLIPFIWLFGSYDALKVSLDDLKKEPLLDRIKYANNRRRTQGWVRGISPHFKRTIVLGLFLILLLMVIDRYSPINFYSDQLTDARARLQKQGMTIVPDLISRVFSVAASAGK